MAGRDVLPLTVSRGPAMVRSAAAGSASWRSRRENLLVSTLPAGSERAGRWFG